MAQTVRTRSGDWPGGYDTHRISQRNGNVSGNQAVECAGDTGWGRRQGGDGQAAWAHTARARNRPAEARRGFPELLDFSRPLWANSSYPSHSAAGIMLPHGII